jgi:DNA adenine methylase
MDTPPMTYSHIATDHVRARSRTTSSSRRQSPRPVLKWAGGKTQLLAHLLRHVPATFGHYWEPFIGSAALFFELRRQGRIKRATLSDVNADLIDMYRIIRDDVEALIEHLGEHEHYKFDHDYYYTVRRWDRQADWRLRAPVERAARLIFLNKTCYNGLHRVNRRGEFNVPWGRYRNPTVCDAANLRAASDALHDVELQVGTFSSVLREVDHGDFVYLDPPYVPLSTTASFTAYSEHSFGHHEHHELASVFGDLAGRGSRPLLSNSDTLFVRDLYQQHRIEAVPARRAINTCSTARGPVSEVIVMPASLG